MNTNTELAYVYGLYCTCEKCPQKIIRYIGVTRNKPEQRLAQHRNNSGKSAGKARRNWIDKHGGDNVFQDIIEVAPLCGIENRERYWIAFYRTYKSKHGLNMTLGGEGVVGYEYSSETRELMSSRAKERIRRGGVHPNLISALQRSAGSANARSVSDEETVSKMKRDVWDGMPKTKVAEKYGVSVSFVSHMSNGRTWKHVPWPIGPARPSRFRELLREQSLGRTHRPESIEKMRAVRAESWTPEKRAAQSEKFKTDNPSTRRKGTVEAAKMNAKYSDELVREIRKAREEGLLFRELSERFGINLGVIRRMVYRETYWWVE